MGTQELEMVDHRVMRESDLASDAHALGAGLHPLELDAVIGRVTLDPVETLEEIEVPPRSAVFAVGDGLEPDFLLPPDDVLDLAVFGRFERLAADLALVALSARLLEGRGAQNAADVIGAKRRL